MAKKKGVYVFDKDAQDFTTTGKVGDLRPLSAVFIEEKNGQSEVVIRLPYDKLGKWKAAQKANIIKCQVPVQVSMTLCAHLISILIGAGIIMGQMAKFSSIC